MGSRPTLTIIYADASALVKLLILEPESDAVRRALREADATLTCEVAGVELACVARRQHVPDAPARTRAITDRLRLLPLDADVLAAARDGSTEPPLRALDALHLACAARASRLLGGLAFLCFDADLGAAASATGLAAVTFE